MENKDMIKILAILVASLVLIVDPSWYTGLFKLSGGHAAAENVSGTAVFKGTIRTYDPILVVPSNTSQAVIDRLRAREDVRNVRLEGTEYVIETETRYDVYTLGSFLRGMNVSSYTIANIAMPQEVEVETSTGRINATTSGAVRVVTEPLLEIDSDVTVSMVATVAKGALVSYSAAEIPMERPVLRAQATVAELRNMTFTYEIPWGGRAQIDLQNLSGYDYEYRRVNTIVFSPQLPVEQIVAKKKLPYITYIDAGSAEVSPEFTNTANITADFNGSAITFLPSTLKVRSAGIPSLWDGSGQFRVALNYTPSISYSYVIALPQEAGGYELGNASFVVESASALELNSTLPVDVGIVALGGKVLSIRDVSLPS